VGYGKTEVAIRAAFKAVLDNKQVAYLAPTTVLSRQHYYTFKNRLDKHGIKVELLNRFITPAKQRKVLHDIRAGIVDIVIGTHRILSKDMKYADLGLLIIDEEQRFGVEHKERIKEFKINVDVLSLSATPIPRTLQMAIMGVKSMSLLETPPKNRYPIQTYVLERHDAIIRDAIQREMARHGQTFYLYNKVEDINIVAEKIRRLVPEARVAYAHGQMGRVQLEDTIEAFLDKEYDVLVSTTIIETGIDIPNANTLLIHDSDRLGLAQLYQIRGRVGRSDKIAYAYLMYTKQKQLNENAQKRLQVIKEFTELGSGFKIAMRDLAIRGAGDVLGTEQSGFIDSVGIDLYLEILKEEIAKQQGTYIEKDTSISTIKVNVNKYIDVNYVNNDFVKVEMHRKIANIKSKVDINNLIDEFTDRFGKPSQEVILYMYEKLYEYLGKKVGIEKIRETKNNVTFIFSEEKTKELNGEYLFTKANEISKFIRFSYRLNKINIIIDTVKLNKHYLYLIVDLLEAI
ncbi:MAG: helicase-related protein, partial [Candidatus Izemoplasma sp.]